MARFWSCKSCLAYLGSIFYDAMWVIGDISKGIWLGSHPCSRKSSVLHVGIRRPLNVEWITLNGVVLFNSVMGA